MQAQGTITFKLVPAGSSGYLRESKVRVRAHFDYDPREDKHIPCKEAGLPFKKGDILHIVTQDERRVYYLLTVHFICLLLLVRNLDKIKARCISHWFTGNQKIICI